MTAPTPEQRRMLMKTPPTPEQYRALAQRAVPNEEHMTWSAVQTRDLASFHLALRAAADQLEAVQRIGEHVAREYEGDPALDAMLAAITAGTAPQEDRND